MPSTSIQMKPLTDDPIILTRHSTPSESASFVRTGQRSELAGWRDVEGDRPLPPRTVQPIESGHAVGPSFIEEANLELRQAVNRKFVTCPSGLGRWISSDSCAGSTSTARCIWCGMRGSDQDSRLAGEGWRRNQWMESPNRDHDRVHCAGKDADLDPI